MIQDIYPHELLNQYDPAAVPQEEDCVFCFDGTKILMRKEGQMCAFPKVRELPSKENLTFLFRVDEQQFFLMPSSGPLPEGFSFEEVNFLRRNGAEKHMAFAAMTGKHLADWYRDSRFCGRCGTEMKHSGTERAMVCPNCRNTVYPRIMPAVIVGVTNGDSLLLTRYRVGYGHNALIAGFTEIGETLEQTVAREVMEEAGLRVKNIRYYKSQPWGIANDILVGYYCDVDGDPTIHMDPQELKYAQWVAREEIELQPDSFSLTNEMMMMIKNGEK